MRKSPSYEKKKILKLRFKMEITIGGIAPRGPYMAVRDPTGPYCTIPDRMGPIRTIMTIWDQTGP